MSKNGLANLVSPLSFGTTNLLTGNQGLGPTQQNSTSTQVNSPWKPTIPYWQQTYGNVFGTPESKKWMAGQGMVTTPSTPGLLNTQMNNPNPDITSGWNTMRTQINDPANQALLGGSRDYANRILSGEMLDPNKNLQLAMQLQNGLADMGSWDQAASNAGRYGSDTWSTGRGKQLADLQGNLYGQGLQQMTQMAGMAPGIFSSQMLPGQMSTALGSAQEQRPWDLYNQATGFLRGTGGGSSATTNPYYTQSPMMQLMGIGMAGLPMLAGAGGGSAGKGGAGAAAGGGSQYFAPQIPSYGF